jgi:dTDP-4-dehydrorhamnose 3,5-epimerase-like enzyme
VYRLIDPYFTHRDDRGEILGVLNFGAWREINFVSSVADTERGNHYHRDTDELFFVLKGSIRVEVQRVEAGCLVGPKDEFLVRQGAIFMVDRMVNHVFHVLDDADWINVLSQPIDPGQPDIYRIALE